MVYITTYSHQKVTYSIQVIIYMGPNIGFVCTILTYYLFHQSLVGRLAGFDTNVYPRAGVCWPLAAETSKGQYHRKAHLYDRYHCIISSKHVSLSWLVITWNGVKNGVNSKPKMLIIHFLSCGVNAKQHEFTWISIKVGDSSSSRFEFSEIASISQPTVLSVCCDCILKRVAISWWCCMLQINTVSFNDSLIVFEEWKLIVFEEVHQLLLVKWWDFGNQEIFFENGSDEILL